MHREQMMTIDPSILLSWANMKLRDEYHDLSSLCEEFNLHRMDLEKRLEEIGYKYNDSVNQFKWHEF